MKKLYQYYPHLLSIVGFIIISIIYFYPILQGKKLYQSDIVQYTGMAKNQNDFRSETGKELYWTDSAFCGMPTYQLGAHYPHNYIKSIDGLLRFLPRPADYLFLYFLSFYVLIIVLKIDTLKAFFGALAFGFSTYLIIIFGAGHNAKAHAIAYMPLVIAGVILIFRKRYIVGGLLTTIAVALEINANHFQMTYYLLFLLIFIGLFYSIRFLKNKEYKHLTTAIAILMISGLLAIGTNATNLLATSEFSNFSIRSKSELGFNPDGSKNFSTSSMDHKYITEYSYGITESLNLIFPRLFGGGSYENLDKNSVMYKSAIDMGATPTQAEQFVSDVPTYWGEQPLVEAPAYVGAVVFFLVIFCLFSDKRKIKYVFFAGILFSLILSWGKNFNIVTDFFINYVPIYDKFRAVSSIQVILELCMPVLGMMGLHSFFQLDKESQWKYLKMTIGLVSILIVFLFFFKEVFSFTSYRDQQYLNVEGGPEYLNAVIEQRKDLYTNDLFRSGILMFFTALFLWLSIKNKFSNKVTTIIIGVFMVLDLFLIDRNYLNNNDFVNASDMETPFATTSADQDILKDTSHFRVYEPQGRLQGRASYFHKSVGGYSAVRPRKADQVFIYQVEPKFDEIITNLNRKKLSLDKSLPVLDMLNIKYLILQEKSGDNIAFTNTNSNGSSWFVEKIKKVDSADEEMKMLASFDSKKVSIINSLKFPNTIKETTFLLDDSAKITLDHYEPDFLQYSSNNKNNGFAVFSEVYYPKGWKAFIDGKFEPHIEVDYMLRGMNIPAGKHKIEFKFEPEVITIGSNIALVSFIIIIFFSISGIYFLIKKYRDH